MLDFLCTGTRPDLGSAVALYYFIVCFYNSCRLLCATLALCYSCSRLNSVDIYLHLNAQFESVVADSITLCIVCVDIKLC